MIEIWKECTGVSYFATGSVDLEAEYIVRFYDNGVIQVAYDDDQGAVCYEGKELGEGHYILKAPERKGRATLHRTSPESLILEGCWEENGFKGMWRINLRNKQIVDHI